MTTDCPVITIDGPSGSGKGTISRLVAQATGFALLDSGAIYRLAALACLRTSADLGDETAVVTVATNLDIAFESAGTSTRVLLAGEDVSLAIREETVGMAASRVAALPAVREALLKRQRDFARLPGLVADGRDMGTVVFPDAGLKIFLTASAEERARRRVLQLTEAGASDIDEAQILADIQERDDRDRNRAASPLVPAGDALELDSTALSIDEVFQQIMAAARDRGLASPESP